MFLEDKNDSSPIKIKMDRENFDKLRKAYSNIKEVIRNDEAMIRYDWSFI